VTLSNRDLLLPVGILLLFEGLLQVLWNASDQPQVQRVLDPLHDYVNLSFSLLFLS
jgi:hypothetical protein